MKRLILFTALVSLVTLGSFWGGRKMCLLMWPGSVNPQSSWYLTLGLNASQAESLKKLEFSFRPEADKLCMKICKEKLALLELVSQREPDPALIDRKIEEVGRLQVVLEKQIASHILKVKKNLTSRQSEVYLERIRKELYQAINQSGYGEIAK